MGRKVFTREVLSSADVNELLMNQAVMRFASAAARSAAIPTPAEGMVTTLDDTGRVERYDPANSGAWESVGPRFGSKVVSGAGSLTPAQRGELTVTGIRVRKGQRLSVRCSVEVSHTTASAQTNELQSMRINAGSTATATLVTSNRWTGRQPTASDVTNWTITLENLIDVNTDGLLNLGWYFQVGTGGAHVVLGNPGCSYTVGDPAL